MNLGSPGRLGSPERSLESCKSVQRSSVVADVMLSSVSEAALLMVLLPEFKLSVMAEDMSQSVDGVTVMQLSMPTAQTLESIYYIYGK